MPGMWLNGLGGTNYKYLLQYGGPYCGPCCVGTVVNLIHKGNQLDCDQLVEEGKALVQGGWNPGVGANVAFMKQLLDKHGVEPEVIRRPALMKQALQRTTPEVPRIALVKLTGVGSTLSTNHYVVFVSRRPSFGRSSTYTVLDPAKGEGTNLGSQRYTVPGTDRSGDFVCVIVCTRK